MANKVIQVVHRIIYAICFIGMIVLLIMMLLTTGDVAGRSLFNRPIAGTYEVTSYMLVVIILLGLGYSQQINQHVRVDILTNKLPKIGQFILSTLFTFVATIFFSLVAWQGVSESLNVMRVKTHSDILHIPSYPFQFLVAAGASLLVIELLIKIVIMAIRYKKGIFEKETTGNVLAMD